MKSISHSVAILVACLANAANYCCAETVTYTLDPARSSLTMGGEVLGVAVVPQAAGANLATYQGTITGDLSGGLLTFTGGSLIDAQLNPAGPFVPASAGVEDNYGLLADTIPVVFRDLSFDITSGTVQDGLAPSGMSFPAAFVIDSPLASGADTDNTANTSAAFASLVTAGGLETLTIPILRDSGAGGALHIVLEGQLVATRLVPEPATMGLASWGLLGCVWGYRRRRVGRSN